MPEVSRYSICGKLRIAKFVSQPYLELPQPVSFPNRVETIKLRELTYNSRRVSMQEEERLSLDCTDW